MIVCTYNDSKYLNRALNSILIQKVKKEIIVVDDCSTEPIVEEATKLIEENAIKLIRHDVNKGLSASRNTGIAASKYDLIIPLDSDDYFYPRAFSFLLREYNNIHDVYYGNITNGGIVSYPFIERITKDTLLSKNPLFSSSMFIKSMWEKVGGYKVLKGAHYEDWNLWCRFFLAGARFKYSPVLVYEHTEREDSMLRTLASNKEKYIKIATEELRASA